MTFSHLCYRIRKDIWGTDQEGISKKKQWGICGDTFIVGCHIPETCVYSEFNSLNQDTDCPLRNSPTGIYQMSCGLDNCMCSWGHDEFLYRILTDSRNKHTLPKEGLWMIRYHSLYPWHSGGEYRLLENNQDKEMKKWVQLFNKYDLYTKENVEYSSSELKNLKKYYDNLTKKFFKTDKIWW